MPTFIFFNGVRYRLEPKSGYYRNSNRSLHRAVWEAANGPIPRGYHVHHRFENDQATTDVSRLELLTPADHSTLHSKTNPWIGSPAHLEHCAKHIKPLQKGYQNTEWGKEVLRRRIESRKKMAPKFEVPCDVCGKKYLVKARFKNKRHVCSRACEYVANKRSPNFMEERSCYVCGKSFTVPRQRRVQACSISCGRWGRPKAAA